MEPNQRGSSHLRVLSGHQPHFLPSIDYFAKIDRADVFVISDDVSFTPGEWQNRNRIHTRAGWQWLTVPVHAKNGMPLCDVRVANGWQKGMERTLRYHLGKLPFFATQAQPLVEMIAAFPDGGYLVDLQMQTLRYVLAALQINTPLVRASERWGISPLPVSQKLRRQMTDTRCAIYLSGPSGRDYLDVDAFNGVNIEVFDFTPGGPQWRCAIIQLLAQWTASALFPIPAEIGLLQVESWR